MKLRAVPDDLILWLSYGLCAMASLAELNKIF